MTLDCEGGTRRRECRGWNLGNGNTLVCSETGYGVRAAVCDDTEDFGEVSTTSR